MGAEVQGLSLDPEVAPRSHSAAAAFGRWLLEQRQLRGLSRSLVAARTRIAPERIAGIERGEVLLGDDALGRGTVRQLLIAIGGEPAEGFARLGWSEAPPARAPVGTQPRSPWLWVAGVSGLVLAAALLYGGARWLDGSIGRADPGVVYRPDYVEDLLAGRERMRGS